MTHPHPLTRARLESRAVRGQGPMTFSTATQISSAHLGGAMGVIGCCELHVGRVVVTRVACLMLLPEMRRKS